MKIVETKSLLYYDTGKSSFVIKDLTILKSKFTVIDYSFQASKLSLAYQLVKQFFHTIYHLPKCDAVIVQFAGYHSLIPFIFASWFGKKKIIIAGGTDCVSFPSIGYGTFQKLFLKWFTKKTFELASLILPVDETLIDYSYTYSNDDFPRQGYRNFVKNISGKEIVKGDLNKTQDDNEVPDNEVPDKSTISNLVVTYNNLTGKSKDIADTVVSQLKKIGITNPYTIIVICSILIKKYGTITESSILGNNKIKIPKDGAHNGQSGRQSNNAWDIAVPIGTPVYAVNSGTVVTFTNNGPNIIRKNGKKIFGTGFTVKTDNKLPSVFYTHLKDTTISKGSKISCGQLLGYVMDFPGSSYDHLHIGVEKGNIRQFITDDGTLKCKSKYSKNDGDETPTKSEGNTLPPEIQKLIDKLKSKWGVTITQKHIDAEFKQEGDIRPDNGGDDSQAKKKIEELIKDCKLANPTVIFPNTTKHGVLGLVSGYRSYAEQVDNFGSKAKKNGIDATQKYNTVPGFSQHHTGKAFDIFSVDTSWWDKNSKVKKWVADNCGNYGFEVTYTKPNKLRIPEPWHLYYK